MNRIRARAEEWAFLAAFWLSCVIALACDWFHRMRERDRIR